ncbi:TetR family transcriptional regulator [Croceibacterium mercuriale]|uniref:TetR family transcriptional regulator n=1 Tax=Croceibacterium mercuriale TaxID=1572751 RepID=A0A0B2C0Y4_9SPHN|nr:TetR/AcrR family transcriptional regulator [Croceibacterium mercuriale]KHL25825.1 TetR family transcriptional regulator [Croceibacterium mercuriale]
MSAGRRAQSTQENRARMVTAARKAFAANGYVAASMDDLTADAGLSRGALYHGFGGKAGLLAVVVEQIDSEMAARAQQAGAAQPDRWNALLAEAAAYIEMALEPEIRRIVLLDGPAILGDPSLWPSQNACLALTRSAVADLIADGTMQRVDVEAAARLLNGAALNAALWLASSEDPQRQLPDAIAAFRIMASGFLQDSRR